MTRGFVQDFTTGDLICELEKRGFIVNPKSEHKLSWNRTIEKDFNEEAFKWEAAHKIGGQIEPKHLWFDKTELIHLKPAYMSGILYLR